MTILAVYREPFSFSPQVRHLPDGSTLAEMRNLMPGLPDDFDARGVICLNGQPVPQAAWPLIRPKPTVTEVTFHYRLQGGGEGGKNVLAVVASIGLTLISGGIASGQLLGGLTGAAAAGHATVASLALAAGVSLAGSLLLSALIPPPSIQSGPKKDDDPGAASARGNVLSPNAAIPRVVGERKVYPPLAMEPLTYFDGPDEVVEAAYILSGPHRIRDIRIGAAPIEDMTGVDYETREGWPGDAPITLLRRQSRTEAMQSELRGHIVSSEDNRTLENVQGDLISSLPQAQVLATRQAPDEHQIQIAFAQGLGSTTDTDRRLRVPMRLRIRPVGEVEWINLPELHFQASRLGQIRATIRLTWSDFDQSPDAAIGEGWVEARRASAGQTAAPASSAWIAHSHFGFGTGQTWLSASNLQTSTVQNVTMSRYTATIFLDPSIFAQGRYEVEIVRGAAFDAGNYQPSGYTYDGSVWDLFGVRGTPGQIVMSRENIVDTLYILRSVSIWNEHPLPSRDVAVVAVRARNRQLDDLSCVAGGWVRDWGGVRWGIWRVTDNPAPHLRDIYAGAENLDPVPDDLIDNAALVAWRQHCIDMGYTCNALIEDQSVDDAARIVASCGYAKPYMSDVWGVIWDRDRSAEAPMQIFTPRNMSGFQWTKAFARVPDGFRVNFPDRSRDYDQHQISVFRPGSSDDNGRMEQITYEGIVDEAEAIRHAEYDQMQAQIRSTFYSWDCAAESILCRRGDLIGLQHDMLTEHAGSARIRGIETNGAGLVTSIWLDSTLPVISYHFMDQSPNLAAEENLALLGMRTGIAISRASGVTVHPVSGSDGVRLDFSPPISAAGIAEGALVVAGPLGQEYRRLIVFGVTPRPNYEATVTAVPEAPQLWN